MRTISSSISAAAAMLVLLSAGCASGPTVRVDKDPSVNLRAYKTFAFFESVARSGPLPALPVVELPTRAGLPVMFEPPAGGNVRYTTLQTQHLQHATREQMERQGYVYDEAHPDLRVNADLHVDEKFELRSTPGAYGYIGFVGAVDSAYYRQGTLSVDLIDVRRNALVWQGVAEGRVDTQATKDPGPAIAAAVAEIFAGFPDGKGK
jgi:hypothetical protein